MITDVPIAVAATLAAAALLGSMHLSEGVQAVILYGRRPILAILVMFGPAVVYGYGPSREDPQWRWVSIGAVVTTVVWLIGSIGFSIYVRNFGSYNEPYGA